MPPVDLAAPVETAAPEVLERRWPRLRRVAAVLGGVLVWVALLAPDHLDQLSFATLVRVPVEALVLIVAALVLPVRWRRAVAVVAGVLIAVLAVLKVLDTGFVSQLDRPFNAVDDWGSFGPALGVVRDSVGSFWTDVLVVVAIVAAVALAVVMPLAMVRLSAVVADRRRTSTRVLAVLAVVWIGASTFGSPIASSSTASLAEREVRDIHRTIVDSQRFTASLTAPDAYASMPAARLLSGLRGKDVLLVFVESYGRVAIQNSWFAPPTDDLLRRSTAQLSASGFSARSAFLTSSTFGGISWLAHSTLQSGTWVDSQQRYDELVTSPRFSLTAAFKRAGWRTVSDVPSDTKPWPEGHTFYHFDKLYNVHNVGYRGPRFSYASMPDQFTFAALQRNELAPGHRPVMAEIDLVSSHTPWAPLPHLVPWSAVGDGSVFGPQPAQGRSPSAVWQDSRQVQAGYAESIRYSISAFTSWVQQLHDPNLVVVMLGDHQPSHIVSGRHPGHDVPISIIASDPSVLSRVESWGWQDGLLPSPSAPVWQMDQFRNRFFSAYSG